MSRSSSFLFCLFSFFIFNGGAFAVDSIDVGSKIFTESYILAEIGAQLIEDSSHDPVHRKLGMGSTGMLFEALKGGSIDFYPDYTGTIAETILKRPQLKSLDEIKNALSPLGLTISGSLGFNNTYALAVTEAFAEAHNLQSMSDLVPLASTLRVAFSYEFMDRQDGYQNMVKRYGYQFDPKNLKRMEHSLVYQAIHENAVDVIEVYSTDANINKFNLRLLKDNLNYFPAYNAVWIARKEFARKHPKAWKSLLDCENKITLEQMRSMNAAADIDYQNFGSIASQFLGLQGQKEKNDLRNSVTRQILQRTREHLGLVGVSIFFSVCVGIPLGIISSRNRLAGQTILLFSALIQTVPTLALLCFLIPVFGVGIKPALVALCLYSLLPVVLNTFTGLQSVDTQYIENAKAFGLSSYQILVRIWLPIASPAILAGVKTATIVSIGTATLAALIGAGGYGALILSGLSLNHIPTILMGAIPAAVMALVAHGVFQVLGSILVPQGLQARRN